MVKRKLPAELQKTNGGGGYGDGLSVDVLNGTNRLKPSGKQRGI